MEDVMEFLKELEVEGAKQVSRRTVERHIKTIIDLGFESIECRNTENGIVYMLKASTDDKYFIKIPYAQIRELLITHKYHTLEILLTPLVFLPKLTKISNTEYLLSQSTNENYLKIFA